MEIYSLSMATDFTDFVFPIKEEENQFYDIVENYFEETLSAKKAWQSSSTTLQ